MNIGPCKIVIGCGEAPQDGELQIQKKNAHLAFNRCEFRMGHFARYTCGNIRSDLKAHYFCRSSGDFGSVIAKITTNCISAILVLYLNKAKSEAVADAKLDDAAPEAEPGNKKVVGPES